MEQYAYAVSRIKAREAFLLSMQDLEQVLSSDTIEEAKRVLSDKGFDGNGEVKDTEELLKKETEKIWSFIWELVEDKSVFDVFLLRNDYHNLKAALKADYMNLDMDSLYLDYGTVDKDVIKKAVKDRDALMLPENMRETYEKAQSVLLKTGDGQLCDIIVDKACLEAIKTAGDKSEDEMIKKYAELYVALSDVKIAVRGNKLHKSADFFNMALAKCDTLDVDALVKNSLKGAEELYDYLKGTAYSGAVEALSESYSAFEKWCDNLIVDHIKKQKYNAFTLGPIASYIVARENEIKAVRIILSGISNDLSSESVRERLRDMYV